MKPVTMPTAVDLLSLIRQHQAGVWRYLRSLGCQVAEADELTQETFLAAFQIGLKDYHPAATAAYLRKVARSQFITSQRKKARSVSLVELDAVDAEWSKLAADDGGQGMLEALEECLRGLTERARQAIDLRFRDNRSRMEIAACLSLSEDGAKNLLQRAKQQLRECIERKLQ